MESGDYLVKVISESGTLRAYACVTTGVVNEAYSRINPSSLAGVMLGRAISGIALLGGTVKGEERLSLKIEGGGPLKKIIAESDAYGNIRGTIGNESVEFVEGVEIHQQIREAIGKAGVLTVTKDLAMKEPYSGSVHLISGEIGEDIAFYLTESEQIPSAVAVAALPSNDGKGVDVAGGYLIQSIPSEGGVLATEDANIESVITMINSLPPLSKLLSLGNSPQNIIAKLFSEVPYKELEIIPLNFSCSCSHNALRRAIKMLGADDISEMVKEDGTVASCNFCKKEYQFSSGELKAILAELKN